jgi:hypothetical protein
MIMIGTLRFSGYSPTNAALTITLSLGAVAMSVIACGGCLASPVSQSIRSIPPCDAEDRVSASLPRKERIGRFCRSSPSTTAVQIYPAAVVGHSDRVADMLVRHRRTPIAIAFVRAAVVGVDHAGSGSIAEIGHRRRSSVIHRRTAKSVLAASAALLVRRREGPRDQRAGFQIPVRSFSSASGRY